MPLSTLHNTTQVVTDGQNHGNLSVKLDPPANFLATEIL